MDIDPWDELNRRYRHDDRAQFLLFVEQMNEARQLLLEDRLGKQRLGLIAVDNLAEMLLYRISSRSFGCEVRTAMRRSPAWTESDCAS